MGKIQTLSPAPPARMSMTGAGRRLGLDRNVIRRLVKQGHIKKLDMPKGIKANLLTSSVEALAARMYGDDRQTG